MTPNPGLVLLVRSKDGGRLNTRDPAVRREVRRISRALAKARYVGRVDDPVENPLAARSLIARDGRSLVIAGYLSSQDVESDGGEAAEDALRLTRSDDLQVTLGGFATSFNEVNDQTRKDLTKAEMIAFPILAILLLIVFRGVVAAGIPLFIGVVSILGTFLVLRIMSGITDTSLFALNIATALSLGLAVDYALLLVSRYREELEAHGPTREAHRTTVLTAGRTTLFSGFTVAVAMAALGLLPQRFLYSMAVAGAAVALLTAVIAILVVPALLSVLGERVNALSVRRGHRVADESAGWARLARWVMRRPIPVMLATTALLLLLAAPALTAKLTGPSAEAVPPTQPSYATNTYVQDALRAGGGRGHHGDREGADERRAARGAEARDLGGGWRSARAAVHPRILRRGLPQRGARASSRWPARLRTPWTRSGRSTDRRSSSPGTRRGSWTRNRALPTTCHSWRRSSR